MYVDVCCVLYCTGGDLALFFTAKGRNEILLYGCLVDNVSHIIFLFSRSYAAYALVAVCCLLFAACHHFLSLPLQVLLEEVSELGVHRGLYPRRDGQRPAADAGGVMQLPQ